MLKVNNSNYAGQVVKITKTIELDNCSAIQHANILGNLVIVSKDTEEGDVGIYFPVECKLSDEFLRNNNLYKHSEKNRDNTKTGYFEDSGRIKAVKFRGHVSNGLFVELNSLDFINPELKKILKVGNEFNEIKDIKICEKYVVKTKERGCKAHKNSVKEKKRKQNNRWTIPSALRNKSTLQEY